MNKDSLSVVFNKLIIDNMGKILAMFVIIVILSAYFGFFGEVSIVEGDFSLLAQVGKVMGVFCGVFCLLVVVPWSLLFSVFVSEDDNST